MFKDRGPFLLLRQGYLCLLKQVCRDWRTSQWFVGWNEYVTFCRTANQLTFFALALTWGAYAVGMLCSLFGYIYLRCESSECPIFFRAYSKQIHTRRTTSTDNTQLPWYCSRSWLASNVVSSSAFAEAVDWQPASSHSFFFHRSWRLHHVSYAIDENSQHANPTRRFVGLGEDPYILAQRAPELFGASVSSLSYN